MHQEYQSNPYAITTSGNITAKMVGSPREPIGEVVQRANSLDILAQQIAEKVDMLEAKVSAVLTNVGPSPDQGGNPRESSSTSLGEALDRVAIMLENASVRLTDITERIAL